MHTIICRYMFTASSTERHTTFFLSSSAYMRMLPITQLNESRLSDWKIMDASYSAGDADGVSADAPSDADTATAMSEAAAAAEASLLVVAGKERAGNRVRVQSVVCVRVCV